MEEDWVPEELWRKFRKYLPTVCVDAVIFKNGKVLLVKRRNVPAKGEWWFPGGRVKKWETLEDALIRQVKEETGLDVTSMRFIGVFSPMFYDDDIHTVNITYAVTAKGKVKLNDEHDEFIWTREFNKYHPYVKKVIEKARRVQEQSDGLY